MPQTGPRPVYKAPIVVPSAPVAGTGNQAPGAGIQRGKPIFDRNRPVGGPGSFTPRPSGGPSAPGGQFAGGPRPKHPTRTTPGGYAGSGAPGAPGARPGFKGPWRTPAVSQDQRRPDEGLCATAALWRSAIWR